jgi:hypothetical protein
MQRWTRSCISRRRLRTFADKGFARSSDIASSETNSGIVIEESCSYAAHAAEGEEIQMRRWFPLLCVIALALVPAGSARAAGAATAPSGDFVVGGGTTATFIIAVTPTLAAPFRFENIVLDAHSDPNGANAGGTVSFMFVNAASPPAVSFAVGGPVTCLAVSGHTAVIGFNDTTFGNVVVSVVDNGSAGSPPDEFFSDPLPTTCGELGPINDGGPLVSGDITVHDAIVATSRQQCLGGGWHNLVDNTGKPFGNQGSCVAFVNH